MNKFQLKTIFFFTIITLFIITFSFWLYIIIDNVNNQIAREILEFGWMLFYGQLSGYLGFETGIAIEKSKMNRKIKKQIKGETNESTDT